MQKIYLKPAVNEIAIEGDSKEGHTDVFSYDYHEDDNKRKLGGLYIIGNVKQDHAAAEPEFTAEDKNAPDIAYVANLVASLAKREYYSITERSPRDAFSATLKKINDVIEEFFKNKSLKVNIGIFAIAGEDIIISKLGKFKIILGRDSRTVDILNNIDLFNKERIEEKEFSNIVSGKVKTGDKLFAFYPNRMLIAREKTIKAELLRADAEQFKEKIKSIRETRPDFDCGALYLSMEEHRESAVKKIGAAVPKNTPTDENISVNLAKANIKELDKPAPLEPALEAPKIRSSEFSLARKSNPLLSLITAPAKIARTLYRNNVNLKSKFIILSLVAGAMVIGIVLVKIFVVIDPEQRQLNIVINQSRDNLKLAQTRIAQNDLIGTRQLLAESLSGIYSVGITNDKVQKTIDELYKVLDDIDKAVDISPTLLKLMPEELNQRIAVLNTHKDQGIAIDIYKNNLYILTNDNILKISDIDNNSQAKPSVWLKSGLPPQPTMLTVDGNVFVMNGSGTISVYYKGAKTSEDNTFLISKTGDTLLTSENSDKLYMVNKTLARIYELDKKSKSLIRTLKIGSSEPIGNAYLYGDGSIIITTKDGRIWEISLQPPNK